MMMEVDSLLPEVGLELFKTVCLRERYINRLQSQLQQKYQKQVQLIIKERREQQKLKQKAKKLLSSSLETDKKGGRAKSADQIEAVVSVDTIGSVEFPIDLPIIGTVDLLRETSVTVTELLVKWEKAQVTYPHVIQPFLWNQQVYTEKMLHDCDFLAEYPSFINWIGFSPIGNPFLVPLEIFQQGKTLFFLSDTKDSFNNTEVTESHSYVIFGTKPTLAISKQAKKVVQKTSKSPYETPIINDPQVFAHLSVKNQLNQKFQQMSATSNVTKKGASAEECAELYQCYLSSDQVSKIRAGWQTILDVNNRIRNSTLREHSGIAELSMEEGQNQGRTDNMHIRSIGEAHPSQGHQHAVSFLDTVQYENENILTRCDNDHVHNTQEPIVHAEDSVNMGKIGEIGFFSQSQLLPSTSIVDNFEDVDNNAVPIDKLDGSVNTEGSFAVQSQIVETQPLPLSVSAPTMESAANPSARTFGISGDNWDRQSPEYYAYLDTLNASQRLQPLTLHSNDNINNDSMHLEGSMNKTKTMTGSVQFPNNDSYFTNTNMPASSVLQNNSHSQMSTSQIWTPHELHLQRQVQRRGGELYVLTAAGNIGKMKAPRRSDRFMRLYIDWQMIGILNDRYSMLKEDILGMVLQFQALKQTNQVKEGNERITDLLAAQLSKVKEYDQILKDLQLRQWYLKEQIRHLAKVLAPKGDQLKCKTAKRNKPKKSHVTIPDITETNQRDNASNISKIKRAIHRHEADEFHALFSQFVQFQQDYSRQRQLVKMQDGQARLEDQQRALQVEDSAATRLQTFVRRFFGRKMRQQLLLKYQKSAICIQAAYRKHKMKFMLSDRSQMKRLAEMIKKMYFYRKARALRERLYLEKLHLSSTMLIQRCFRGYLGRRKLNMKRLWLNAIAAAHQAVSGSQHYTDIKVSQDNGMTINNIDSDFLDIKEFEPEDKKLAEEIGSMMNGGEGCDGLTPGVIESLCDSIEDFLRDIPSGDDIPDFASLFSSKANHTNVSTGTAPTPSDTKKVPTDDPKQLLFSSLNDTHASTFSSSTMPMLASSSSKLPFTLLLILRTILFILNGEDCEQITVTNDEGIAEQRFVYAATATWSQVKLVFRRKGRLLRRLRALIRFVSAPNPGKIPLTDSSLAQLQLLYSIKERVVYELMAMNFTYHFRHNVHGTQPENAKVSGPADFHHSVSIQEHPAYRASIHLLSYALNIYRIYHYQHLFPEYFDPSLPSWFRSLMILKQKYDQRDYDRRVQHHAQKRLLEMKNLHTHLGKNFHHIAEALHDNSKSLEKAREAFQKSKDLFEKKILFLQNEEKKKILTCEAILTARSLALTVAQRDVREYLQTHPILILPSEITQLKRLHSIVDLKQLSLLSAKLDLFLAQQQHRQNEDFRQFDQLMPMQSLYNIIGEIGKITGDLLILQSSWKQLVNELGGEQYVQDAVGEQANRVYHIRKNVKFLLKKRKILAVDHHTMQQASYQQLYQYVYDEQRQYRRRLHTGQTPVTNISSQNDNKNANNRGAIMILPSPNMQRNAGKSSPNSQNLYIQYGGSVGQVSDVGDEDDDMNTINTNELPEQEDNNNNYDNQQNSAVHHESSIERSAVTGEGSSLVGDSVTIEEEDIDSIYHRLWDQPSPLEEQFETSENEECCKRDYEAEFRRRRQLQHVSLSSSIFPHWSPFVIVADAELPKRFLSQMLQSFCSPRNCVSFLCVNYSEEQRILEEKLLALEELEEKDYTHLGYFNMNNIIAAEMYGEEFFHQLLYDSEFDPVMYYKQKQATAVKGNIGKSLTSSGYETQWQRYQRHAQRRLRVLQLSQEKLLRTMQSIIQKQQKHILLLVHRHAHSTGKTPTDFHTIHQGKPTYFQSSIRPSSTRNFSNRINQSHKSSDSSFATISSESRVQQVSCLEMTEEHLQTLFQILLPAPRIILLSAAQCFTANPVEENNLAQYLKLAMMRSNYQQASKPSVLSQRKVYLPKSTLTDQSWDDTQQDMDFNGSLGRLRSLSARLGHSLLLCQVTNEATSASQKLHDTSKKHSGILSVESENDSFKLDWQFFLQRIMFLAQSIKIFQKRHRQWPHKISTEKVLQLDEDADQVAEVEKAPVSNSANKKIAPKTSETSQPQTKVKQEETEPATILVLKRLLYRFYCQSLPSDTYANIHPKNMSREHLQEMIETDLIVFIMVFNLNLLLRWAPGCFAGGWCEVDVLNMLLTFRHKLTTVSIAWLAKRLFATEQYILRPIHRRFKSLSKKKPESDAEDSDNSEPDCGADSDISEDLDASSENNVAFARANALWLQEVYHHNVRTFSSNLILSLSHLEFFLQHRHPHYNSVNSFSYNKQSHLHVHTHPALTLMGRWIACVFQWARTSEDHFANPTLSFLSYLSTPLSSSTNALDSTSNDSASKKKNKKSITANKKLSTSGHQDNKGEEMIFASTLTSSFFHYKYEPSAHEMARLLQRPPRLQHRLHQLLHVLLQPFAVLQLDSQLVQNFMKYKQQEALRQREELARRKQERLETERLRLDRGEESLSLGDDDDNDDEFSYDPNNVKETEGATADKDLLTNSKDSNHLVGPLNDSHLVQKVETARSEKGSNMSNLETQDVREFADERSMNIVFEENEEEINTKVENRSGKLQLTEKSDSNINSRPSSATKSRPSSTVFAQASRMDSFQPAAIQFAPVDVPLTPLPPPPLKNPLLTPCRVPHTINWTMATQGRWKLYYDKDCLDSLTTQALGSLSFSFLGLPTEEEEGKLAKVETKQNIGNLDVLPLERTVITVYHQGNDLFIELCVTLPANPKKQIDIWRERSKMLGKTQKNPDDDIDSDDENEDDGGEKLRHDENVDESLRSVVSQVLQNIGLMYTDDELLENEVYHSVNQIADDFFSSIHDYLENDEHSKEKESKNNARNTQCRFISRLSQEEFIQLLQPNYTEIFEGKVKNLTKAKKAVSTTNTSNEENTDENEVELSEDEVEKLLQATYEKQRTNKDFYEMLMGWIVVDLVSDVHSTAKNHNYLPANIPVEILASKDTNGTEKVNNKDSPMESAQVALQLVPTADEKKALAEAKNIIIDNMTLFDRSGRNKSLFAEASLTHFHTSIIRSRLLVLSKLGEISGYFSRLEIYEERFAELRILIFIRKKDLYPNSNDNRTTNSKSGRLSMLQSHYKRFMQNENVVSMLGKAETEALQLLVDKAAVYSLSTTADPLIESQKLETFDTAALSYIFSNRLQISPSKAWLYFVNPPLANDPQRDEFYPQISTGYFDYFSKISLSSPSAISQAPTGLKGSKDELALELFEQKSSSHYYTDMLLPRAIIKQPIITIRKKGGAGRLVGRVLINLLDLFYVPVYPMSTSASPTSGSNGINWMKEEEYYRMMGFIDKKKEDDYGEESTPNSINMNDKRGFTVVMTIFEVQSELPAHELRVVFYHVLTQMQMEIRLSALERVLLFADLRFIQSQRRMQDKMKQQAAAATTAASSPKKGNAEEDERDNFESDSDEEDLNSFDEEKGDARNFLIPDNDIDVDIDDDGSGDEEGTKKGTHAHRHHSGSFVKQLISRLRLVFTAVSHPLFVQHRTFLQLPECANRLSTMKSDLGEEQNDYEKAGIAGINNDERISYLCHAQERVCVHSPHSLLVYQLRSPKLYKVEGSEEYHMIFPSDHVKTLVSNNIDNTLVQNSKANAISSSFMSSHKLERKQSSKMNILAPPARSPPNLMKEKSSKNVLLASTRGRPPLVPAASSANVDDNYSLESKRETTASFRPGTSGNNISFFDNNGTLSTAELPEDGIPHNSLEDATSNGYAWALVFDRAPVAALRGNLLVTITLHSTQQQAFHICVYDPLSHREEFAFLPFSQAIKYLEIPDVSTVGNRMEMDTTSSSKKVLNMTPSMKMITDSPKKHLSAKALKRKQKREKYQAKLQRRKLQEERNARMKSNLEQLMGNVDESVVLMLCEQLLPFVDVDESDEHGIQLKLLPPYYEEVSDDEESDESNYDQSSDEEDKHKTLKKAKSEAEIMEETLKEQQELQAKQRLKRDAGAKLEKHGLVLAQLFTRHRFNTSMKHVSEPVGGFGDNDNMEMSTKFTSVAQEKQKKKNTAKAKNNKNSSLRISLNLQDIQQLTKPPVWQQLTGGRKPLVKVIFNDDIVAQVAMFNNVKRNTDAKSPAIQMDRIVDVFLSRAGLLNISTLQFLVYDYDGSKNNTDGAFLGLIYLQGEELVEYVGKSINNSIEIPLSLQSMPLPATQSDKEEEFNRHVGGILSVVFHSEQISQEEQGARGAGFQSVSLPSANEDGTENQPVVARNRRKNIPNKIVAVNKHNASAGNMSNQSRRGKFASGKFGGGSQISIRRSVTFSPSFAAGSQFFSSEQQSVMQALAMAREAVGDSSLLLDTKGSNFPIAPNMTIENEILNNKKAIMDEDEVDDVDEAKEEKDVETIEMIRDTFFALHIARVSVAVPLSAALKIYAKYFPVAIDERKEENVEDVHKSSSLESKIYEGMMTSHTQCHVKENEEVRVAVRVAVDDCELCTAPATALVPLYDPYLYELLQRKDSIFNIRHHVSLKGEDKKTFDSQRQYTLKCAIDMLALPCHLCRDMPLALCRVQMSLIFTIPLLYFAHHELSNEVDNLCAVQVCSVNDDVLGFQLHEHILRHPLNQSYFTSNDGNKSLESTTQDVTPVRPKSEEEILLHCLRYSFIPQSPPDIPLNHVSHQYNQVKADNLNQDISISSGSIAIYATLHPARAVSLLPICLQNIVLPKHSEAHFAEYLYQQSSLESTHKQTSVVSTAKAANASKLPSLPENAPVVPTTSEFREELSSLSLPLSVHFNHMHYGDHILPIKFKLSSRGLPHLDPQHVDDNSNQEVSDSEKNPDLPGSEQEVSATKTENEIEFTSHKSAVATMNRRFSSGGFFRQASTLLRSTAKGTTASEDHSGETDKQTSKSPGKVVLLRLPWHFTWEQCHLHCAVPLPPQYRSIQASSSIHAVPVTMAEKKDRYLTFSLSGEQIHQLVFTAAALKVPVAAQSANDTMLAFELEDKKVFWQRLGHRYNPVSYSLEWQQPLVLQSPEYENMTSTTLEVRLYCDPDHAQMQTLSPSTLNFNHHAQNNKPFFGISKQKLQESTALLSMLCNNVYLSPVFPIFLPSLIDSDNKKTAIRGDNMTSPKGKLLQDNTKKEIYHHNPFLLGKRLLQQAKFLLPALQRFHAPYTSANYVYFEVHFDGFTPKLPDNLLFHIDAFFNTEYLGFWEYSSGDAVRRSRDLQKSCTLFLKLPRSMGTKGVMSLLRESTLTLSAKAIPHSSASNIKRKKPKQPPHDKKPASQFNYRPTSPANETKESKNMKAKKTLVAQEKIEPIKEIDEDDPASEQRAKLIVSGDMLHWLFRTQQPQTFTWQMPMVAASAASSSPATDTMHNDTNKETEDVMNDTLAAANTTAANAQKEKQKAAAAAAEKSRPLESILSLTAAANPVHAFFSKATSEANSNAEDKGRDLNVGNIDTGEDIQWMKRSVNDEIVIENPSNMPKKQAEKESTDETSPGDETAAENIEIERFVLQCTRVLLTSSLAAQYAPQQDHTSSANTHMETMKLTEYLEEKLEVFQSLRRLRAQKISSAHKEILQIQKQEKEMPQHNHQQQEASQDSKSEQDPNGSSTATTGLFSTFTSLFQQKHETLLFPFANQYLNLRLLVYVNGVCVGHVRIRWNRNYYTAIQKAKNFNSLFEDQLHEENSLPMVEEFTFGIFGAPAVQCPALPAILKQHHHRHASTTGNEDVNESFALPHIDYKAFHLRFALVFYAMDNIDEHESLLRLPTMPSHISKKQEAIYAQYHRDRMLYTLSGYVPMDNSQTHAFHNLHTSYNADPEEHNNKGLTIDGLMARYTYLMKLSERKRFENAVSTSLERGYSFHGLILGEKYLHTKELQKMMQPYHDHLHQQLQQQLQIQQQELKRALSSSPTVTSMATTAASIRRLSLHNVMEQFANHTKDLEKRKIKKRKHFVHVTQHIDLSPPCFLLPAPRPKQFPYYSLPYTPSILSNQQLIRTLVTQQSATLLTSTTHIASPVVEKKNKSHISSLDLHTTSPDTNTTGGGMSFLGNLGKLVVSAATGHNQDNHDRDKDHELLSAQDLLEKEGQEYDMMLVLWYGDKSHVSKVHYIFNGKTEAPQTSKDEQSVGGDKKCFQLAGLLVPQFSFGNGALSLLSRDKYTYHRHLSLQWLQKHRQNQHSRFRTQAHSIVYVASYLTEVSTIKNNQAMEGYGADKFVDQGSDNEGTDEENSDVEEEMTLLARRNRHPTGNSSHHLILQHNNFTNNDSSSNRQRTVRTPTNSGMVGTNDFIRGGLSPQGVGLLTPNRRFLTSTNSFSSTHVSASASASARPPLIGQGSSNNVSFLTAASNNNNNIIEDLSPSDDVVPLATPHTGQLPTAPTDSALTILHRQRHKLEPAAVTYSVTISTGAAEASNSSSTGGGSGSGSGSGGGRMDSRVSLRDSVIPKLVDSSSDSDSDDEISDEENDAHHNSNFASHFFQKSTSLFRQQDKQRKRKLKEKLKRKRRQRRRQMIFASRSSQLVRSHSLRGLTVNSDVVYLDEAIEDEAPQAKKNNSGENNQSNAILLEEEALQVKLPVNVSEIVSSCQISHMPVTELRHILQSSVANMDESSSSYENIANVNDNKSNLEDDNKEFFLAGISRKFQLQVLSRAGVTLGSSVVLAERFNFLEYRHPCFQRACTLLKRILAKTIEERQNALRSPKKHNRFNIMEKNVSYYSKLAMAVINSEERALILQSNTAAAKRTLVEENDILIMRLLGLKPPRQLLKALKGHLEHATATPSATELNPNANNLCFDEMSSDHDSDIDEDDLYDQNNGELPRYIIAEENRWRQLAPFLLHVPLDAVFSSLLPMTLQPFIKRLSHLMNSMAPTTRRGGNVAHSHSSNNSYRSQEQSVSESDRENDDAADATAEEDSFAQQNFYDYRVPRPKIILWNWPVVFHHVITHRLTIDLKLWEKTQALGKSLAAKNLNSLEKQRQELLNKRKKNTKKKAKKAPPANQSVISLISFDGRYSYSSDEEVDGEEVDDEENDVDIDVERGRQGQLGSNPEVTRPQDVSRKASYSSEASLGSAAEKVDGVSRSGTRTPHQHDAQRSAQAIGVQLRIFSGNVRITGLSFRTLIFLVPRVFQDIPPYKPNLMRDKNVKSNTDLDVDVETSQQVSQAASKLAGATATEGSYGAKRYSMVSVQAMSTSNKIHNDNNNDMPTSSKDNKLDSANGEEEESLLLYESMDEMQEKTAGHGIPLTGNRTRANTMMSAITLHSQSTNMQPSLLVSTNNNPNDKSAAPSNHKLLTSEKFLATAAASTLTLTVEEETQKLQNMFEPDASFQLKYGESIDWKLLAENPDSFFYLLSRYHQNLHHHRHVITTSTGTNNIENTNATKQEEPWTSDIFALDELTIVFHCRINPQSLTSSSSITPAQRLRLLTERKNYEVRVPGWLIRRHYLSPELFPFPDLSTKYRRTALGKVLVSLLAVTFVHTAELLRMTVLLPREIMSTWQSAEEAYKRWRFLQLQVRQRPGLPRRHSAGSLGHRQSRYSVHSGLSRGNSKMMSTSNRPSIVSVRRRTNYYNNEDGDRK